MSANPRMHNDLNEDELAADLLGLGSGSAFKRRKRKTSSSAHNKTYSKKTINGVDAKRKSAEITIDGYGLSFDQRKAIIMIVAFNYTDKQTADELGKSFSTIKQWRRKKNFKRALNAATSAIEIDAMSRRRQINDEIARRLQDSILKDIHEGKLHRLPIKDKIQLMSIVSKESRSDDPKTPTATVHHTHDVELAGIQERFNLVANRRRMLEARKETIDAEYEEMS